METNFNMKTPSLLHQLVVGKKYKQVRTNTSECEHLVGRVGTVDDAFFDENGVAHLHTIEDGVWCPIALMEKV